MDKDNKVVKGVLVWVVLIGAVVVYLYLGAN